MLKISLSLSHGEILHKRTKNKSHICPVRRILIFAQAASDRSSAWSSKALVSPLRH